MTSKTSSIAKVNLTSHISYIIVFLFLALPFETLYSQPSAGSEVLSLIGTVSNVNDTSYAGLIDPDKGNYISPLTKISRGSFTINTRLSQPGLYILMVGDPKKKTGTAYYSVFLENKPAVLEILDNNGNFNPVSGDVLFAWKAMLGSFAPDFDRLSQINKMLDGAGTYGYSKDSLMGARQQVTARVAEKVPGFLKAYPSSPVAPFLLNLVYPLQYPDEVFDGWMAEVKPEAMNNQYGAAISEQLKSDRMLGFGRVAPVFVQNDPEEKPVSLEQFRGKYVLIDFWASWCGPCRQENPNVVKAHDQFKSRNFTVLGVSLDRDKKKWVQAISDDKLQWTHVSDLGYWNNAAAKMYQVQSIPQNYLLDPEGRIVAKNLRGPELHRFLEDLLVNK